MIRRIALTAALALTPVPLYATRYTFEPNYTQGILHWDHLGFSKPTAQFSQVEGTLEFVQSDLARSSVMATIPLKQLHTGVPDLDDDFQSANFFDFDKFPAATFKSTKVEKAGGSDRLRVIGNLSMHGVTKPITLDVTLNKIGKNARNDLPSIGFDAATILKRSDYGLGRFVPLVSDEIRIEITAELAETEAYATYLKAEEVAEAKAQKEQKPAAKGATKN